MTASPTQSQSADSRSPRMRGTKKGWAVLVDFTLLKFYRNMLS